MKVHLISHTPDALNLLLRSKNTRLANSEDDPKAWNDEKKAEHLAYMQKTIKSSWEMCDYVFQIEGVTRAFTHQLVRHRHGSYAQEAMRVIDAREHSVMEPPSISARVGWHQLWDDAVDAAMIGYADLIDAGAPAQDARGLLPTAITTSIMAKFNLRSLHEMMKLRLCTRVQGEFQDVAREMRARVVEVHAWADPFLQVQCVADGTCAFENYGPKECPVWHPDLDRTSVKTMMHARFWTIRHESSPRASGGKAQ